MKNNRQEKILAIIEAEPIETQEQLLSKLQEQGIESTQATISLAVVLPELPVTPTTGTFTAPRQAEASSAIARATSGTVMTGPATPSGTLCAILTEETGRNTDMASGTLALSTLFSLGTLPVWALFLLSHFSL